MKFFIAFYHILQVYPPQTNESNCFLIRAITAAHFENPFLSFPKCCWKQSKYTGNYASILQWGNGDMENAFRATELIPGLHGSYTTIQYPQREKPVQPGLIMGWSELLHMGTQLQQLLRGNTYPGGWTSNSEHQGKLLSTTERKTCSMLSTCLRATNVTWWCHSLPFAQ